MSDCYTPTDGEVLEAWAAHNTPDLPTALDLVGAYDAFKRWLAEHDAKVRAEAMQEAAAIVADLRPTGLAVLTRPGMRSRDAILWEAQSAVQRSAREIEKEAGQ